MTTAQWRGKKVLVTGADGFMGSHLTEALVEAGARVAVVVRGTSLSGTAKHTFKNLPETIADRLDAVHYADIASPDIIELVVKAEPQIIMHLAAMAYVPFSFDHPLEVHGANATGTLYILEAARRLKSLERIVCTSSSEVYGTALTERIAESHPLNPTSPYAASKAAADRYCYSFRVTYGLPIAIIRPFNTYGPRHTYDVVPRFIRMAIRDEPITIYGSGEQSRDFSYVSDTISGFLLMGSHAQAVGRAVNFGTGIDHSVKTLAHLIKDIAGSRSRIVHLDTRAAEVNRLCCDSSYAQQLFGWQAKVDIETGLRRNIEWARQHWL